MTDKNEDQTLVQDTQDSENIITVNGKTFDISTSEGRNQLKGYTEATSKLASQKANEAHQLKQQIEPYQKYKLGQQIVDPVAINAEINRLNEEGDVEGAARLATELALQATNHIQASQQQAEEDRFFNEFVKANPEMFEHISPELAKNYAFGQFRDEIYDAENKFGLIAQILQPHIKRSAKEESALDATLGAAPVAPKVKEEAPKEKTALDLIFEEVK